MEAKNNTKAILILLFFTFIGFGGGMLLQRTLHPPCGETIGTTSDTVVSVKKVTPTIPAPQSRATVDVIKIKPAKARTFNEGAKGHTVEEDVTQDVQIDSAGEVSIPIESVEYQTPEFAATVRGWRPELTCIELYEKETTITNNTVKYIGPRWALTVGPYAGYDGKFSSGVAVNFGFVLWSAKPRK